MHPLSNAGSLLRGGLGMFAHRCAVCLVLLFGSHLSLAAAAGQPDPRLVELFHNLDSGKKQTVIAYGTSETAIGYWVTAMQEWFAEQYPNQVTVINSGGSGQNSDWGVAQLQEKVLAHHPDLVLIEFGINDAHVRFHMSVEHARENLDRIVSGIQAQNPATAIVLQTMNAMWDNPAGPLKTGDSSRPHLKSYYDNYRRYGKRHHLPVVDNYPQWLRMKREDLPRFQALLPDGNHPNKEGSLAVTWPNVLRVFEEAKLAARGK